MGVSSRTRQGISGRNTNEAGEESRGRIGKEDVRKFSEKVFIF